MLRRPLRRRIAARRRGGRPAILRSGVVFVNARGERLTRADRLANLRTGRTSVDTVTHAPEEEHYQAYGDVVLCSTLLTLGGQFSGQTLQRGRYRALVVWVRRDGRWQQVTSQLTAVAGR